MSSPVEEADAGPASNGVGSLIETQDYYLGDHVDTKAIDVQALEDALVSKDVSINGEATGLLLKEELTQVVIGFGIGLDLDQLPAVGHKVHYKHVLAMLVKDELSDHHRDRLQQSGPTIAGPHSDEQGGAGAALSPNKFTQRGITESDLSAPRARSVIEKIFASAGLQQRFDFEKVW